MPCPPPGHGLQLRAEVKRLRTAVPGEEDEPAVLQAEETEATRRDKHAPTTFTLRMVHAHEHGDMNAGTHVYNARIVMHWLMRGFRSHGAAYMYEILLLRCCWCEIHIEMIGQTLRTPLEKILQNCSTMSHHNKTHSQTD